MDAHDDRRLIARSAACIFAGATFIGLIEGLIPGGIAFSWVPVAGSLVLAALTVVAGPRVPRGVLMLLGPLGVTLVGVALAAGDGVGDGAVLYMWPVVWTAYFFGLRGTVVIVVWTAIVHAVVLPSGPVSVDRWIDVTTAVLVVAGVVRYLAARNERLVARLAAEARVDSLTGLLNRRGFDERVEIERARLARHDGPAAVIALDFDHFKHVNDAHGHEVGDRVLAWLGSVLSEELRAIDVAARVGGEEFTIVAPRTGAAAAWTLAERLRLAVAAHAVGAWAQHGLPADLTVTVSLGVAVADGPAELDDALAAADRALYEAKRAGRDRTEIARDEPLSRAG
jgi:diguanylate cyclase (GGDEF)-like protein